jgi:PAS domain S-box-containing protein
MLSKGGVRKTKSFNCILDHRSSSSREQLDFRDCESRVIFPGRDRFGECSLAVAYVELGVCTDDLDLNKSQLDSHLPPPCRFVDSRKSAATVTAPKVAAKAVVSIQQPHKILTVSKDLCCLLGYSSEELCGRSIKILQGPKTDATFLHSAIKNAALLSSASQKTFIYARDGQEHEVQQIRTHATLPISPVHVALCEPLRPIPTPAAPPPPPRSAGVGGVHPAHG